jgi:HSP20 family protein
MLTLWHPYSDWNFGNVRRTLSAMEELRREMGEFLGETPRWRERAGDDPWATWPRSCLRDTGEALVINAEVPGLSDKDVEITLTGDTVAIRGERKADAPEGYSVHRKERSTYKFSRSFLLPVKTNPDKAEATVKNGVLELVLPKVPEAQPKKINVTAH